MKKILIPIIIFVAALICASSASATMLTWSNTSPGGVRIDNSRSYPDHWFYLEMPDWYDSSCVTSFTIDLYGSDDNSSNPIDTWVKLNSSGNGSKIAGYDVRNDTDFILRLDLVTGNVLVSYYQRTKVKVGKRWKYVWGWSGFQDTRIDVKNVSLSSFDDLSGFWVGYACHFNLDKTTISIEQTQVPEPSTILLLGSGLVGLAVWRRRSGRAK